MGNPKCRSGFKSTNSVILDLNALVLQLVGRTELGKFECLECGKVLETKQSCERHAEIHLGVTQTCIVCGKVFNTRNSLATHYTKIHGGQQASEIASPWTMK